MAEISGLMSSITETLVNKVFSSILWFGLILFAIGVIGFLMYWFLIYKRKFNIKVKIISARANDRDYTLFDKAAILTDRKTRTKYFRIWGLKIDLPAPEFNVLQNTSEGDYIELYRASEDALYFLTPPIIDKKKVIKSDGREYLIAAQKLKQIDADMSFWAAKRKDSNKKMFDPESILMKLLPYIPLILGGAFMVFMLYILLSYMPEILNELRELISALNTKNTAEITTGAALLWIKKRT